MDHPVILSHDWFPRPLPAHVIMGDRSWCYSSFSCLHDHSQRTAAVEIGHDSGIYHGTFFNLGPKGSVKIGNYCTIVGAIISTNAQVTICDFSFLAHEVVLADSFAAAPFHGSAQPEVVEVDPPRPEMIFVGKNCWIGARAILLRGAQLGDDVIVGAGAVVDFEVPAGSMVTGNPARVVSPGAAAPTISEHPR